MRDRASTSMNTVCSSSRGQYSEVIHKPSAGTQNSGRSELGWPHASRKRRLPDLRCSESCLLAEKSCSSTVLCVSRQKRIPDRGLGSATSTNCRQCHEAKHIRPKNSACCLVLSAHGPRTSTELHFDADFSPCGSLFFFVASCVMSKKCVPERAFRPPNPHMAANGVRSDTQTMQASQNYGAPRLAGRTRAENVY